MKKSIWALRIKIADLELQRARERLKITGDPCYAVEETYWIMIQNLNESFSGEGASVAAF